MNEFDQRVFFKSYFNVSCETMKKFDLYLELITCWQKRFNLIGPSTLRQTWTRHFCDSAKLYNLLDHNFFGSPKKKVKNILDVGTGAGFPGIVMAILANESKENVKMTLIDSSKKKAGFLKLVIKELKLKVEVLNKRVEELEECSFDFITARAFSPLKKFLVLVYPLIKKNTCLIIPKGKTWEKEMISIKNKWKFSKIVVKNDIEIDNSGGVVLLIKDLKH